MAAISDRIRQAMNIRGMKQVDVSNKSGVPKSALSEYISGKYEPKQKALYLLAKALDVNVAWLMGLDVSMEREAENIMPIKTRKIPLLGTIAAGEPIMANMEHDYVDFGSEMEVDFCLRVKGDSMVNARINDGDLVFCRKQETVENGQIAVVIIDDDATLKRFYKENGSVYLVAENPKYKPFVYSEKDHKSVRIIGRAVAFQSLI